MSTSGSDFEGLLDGAETVTSRSQVGGGSVQDQVEDPAGTSSGHGPDDVVPARQGDEDVLDGFVDAELFDGAQLGANHLGAADHSDLRGGLSATYELTSPRS